MVATLHMERMGRPLVHAVIPLIDNLTNMLKAAAANEDLDITIRAGALAGKKILDKYYSKTDQSIIFRIAMGKYASYPSISFV